MTASRPYIKLKYIIMYISVCISVYHMKRETRIAQSEHNVSPIATVEGMANENETSMTSNEIVAILNILEHRTARRLEG